MKAFIGEQSMLSVFHIIQLLCVRSDFGVKVCWKELLNEEFCNVKILFAKYYDIVGRVSIKHDKCRVYL